MPFTQPPPWRGGGALSRRRASSGPGGGSGAGNNYRTPVSERLGPLSSGISTRKLPASSFDEIRKACDHYERKCAGGGSAARHLKDLANEVRTLVGTLEHEYMQAPQRTTRIASQVR